MRSAIYVSFSLLLLALGGCGPKPWIDGSEKAPATDYDVIEGSAAPETAAPDTRLDDLLAAVGELKAASSYRPEPFDVTRVDSLEARVEALERQRSKATEAPKYTQPREQVGIREQECGPGGCGPSRGAPVFQKLPIVRRFGR